MVGRSNEPAADKRGIFAEAVAGDEARSLRKLHAAFLRQRGEDGHRMGHDRGLGIFREPQVIVRPIAHEAEEVLAERLVDLREHVSRCAARFGQRGAHADRLAALSRKKECAHLGPVSLEGRADCTGAAKLQHPRL